LFHPQVG